MDRVTPEVIGDDLPPDVIFVFGSNESGIHGAGAADLAFKVYGASLGQGYGLSAQTFAIPTKDWRIKKLPLEIVKHYVDGFIRYIKEPLAKSGWKYYVTRIGCGLAGFTPQEIAPMFAPLRHAKNVWLPQEFIDIIDGVQEAKAVSEKLEKDGY